MWKLVPSKITKEWLNPTKTINHNPIKKLSGRFTKLVNQPLFLLLMNVIFPMVDASNDQNKTFYKTIKTDYYEK